MTTGSATGTEFRFRDIWLVAHGPSIVSAIGHGAIMPVLALRARDLGADVSTAAAIVALTGVGMLCASLPAGALVARIGERRALVAAGFVDAAAMAFAAVTDSVPRPRRRRREFKRRGRRPDADRGGRPELGAGGAVGPVGALGGWTGWPSGRAGRPTGSRSPIRRPGVPHKKDLLARALAAQGLSVTFLAEPQAAALHYASTERVGVGSTIAVYDLGGGTFDAAVVRKGDAAAGAGPAGFGLLGRPEGLERLGGIDFDEVVFEHVRAGHAGGVRGAGRHRSGGAVRGGPDPARLHRGQGGASSDTEVSIPVLLPAARGSVRLHRSEFEQLIRPADRGDRGGAAPGRRRPG